MSESIHHLFKTFFAPGKIYLNDDHLQKELDAFVQFANYNWFPLEFYGLSPMEVLENGCVDRNRFAEQIKLAQKQRVIENRSFQNCMSCK